MVGNEDFACHHVVFEATSYILWGRCTEIKGCGRMGRDPKMLTKPHNSYFIDKKMEFQRFYF